MGNRVLRWAAGALLAAVIVLATTTFQVREAGVTVVTRFGKTAKVVDEPGLYFKWPWPFEKATEFDRRIRILKPADIKCSETPTRDLRRVILEAYAFWRVTDARKLMERTLDGSISEMEGRLAEFTRTAQSSVIGSCSYEELISTKASGTRDKIEQRITEAAGRELGDTFGVELLKVGIRRIALPESVTEAVFRQMIAGREKESRRYRAEGDAEADRIKADTDAEVSAIVSGAERQAIETRGRADTDAARIYAEAHAKNPEFYKFIQSLDSLRKLVGKKTKLILSTDEPPFDVLREKKK